jgi:hypothetical protein
MFEILAAVDGLKQNGMHNMYSPMGILTLCGIAYLVFLIILVCPKGNWGQEAVGLLLMMVMWLGFSIFFVFGREYTGGQKREVTRIEGVEVTKKQVVMVYECLMGRPKDLEVMDASKFKLIEKHLRTKPVKRLAELSFVDKQLSKSGRTMDIKQDSSDVWLKWEFDENAAMGNRSPSDFEYFYSGIDRSSGTNWFYHPIMWFWCPLISMLFSRIFWMVVLLQWAFKSWK